MLWLTFEGIDKEEMLKGLGFEISSEGLLFLNGKSIRNGDGDAVNAESVKAIVPGSLTVFTDVSEIEDLLEAE